MIPVTLLPASLCRFQEPKPEPWKPGLDLSFTSLFFLLLLFIFFLQFLLGIDFISISNAILKVRAHLLILLKQFYTLETEP